MKIVRGHPTQGFDWQVEDFEYLIEGVRDLTQALGQLLGDDSQPLRIAGGLWKINAQGVYVIEQGWYYVPLLREVVYAPNATIQVGAGQVPVLRLEQVDGPFEPRLQSDDVTVFANRIDNQARWIPGPPGGAGIVGYLSDLQAVSSVRQWTIAEPALQFAIGTNSLSFAWDNDNRLRNRYLIEGRTMRYQLHMVGTLSGTGSAGRIEIPMPTGYRSPDQWRSLQIVFVRQVSLGISTFGTAEPAGSELHVYVPGNTFQAGDLLISGQLEFEIERA